MQFVRLGELVTHLYISTTAAANTTAASAPNASTGQLLTTLRGSCGWRESEEACSEQRWENESPSGFR
jgi:hypothetical protein